MAKKVITFGEIMLRLAPEGYYRFVQADTFGATYGGGEANVAVSLANYGFDAKFVTKLPTHEIGQAALTRLTSRAAATEWASTSWRKALPSVLPRSSMTVRDHLSQLHPHLISTGKRSSTAQSGSTSPASHRRSTTKLQRSAWRPARLQRKPALKQTVVQGKSRTGDGRTL